MTRPVEAGLWRWHVGALALYTAMAFLFLDHGASIKKNILGFGSDPSLIMWFLAWWPWSIAHHLNLLHTNLVWQPAGLNIAWTTCVPFLALIGLPITLLSGPVMTYNVLTLLAPVLAGLAAYFLCLRLTKVPLAALIGGYLFGFSSYEMAETLDHLNLDFTVFIPLLVLLIIRRLENDFGRLKFVLLGSLCLVCQFLITTEIFATSILFGGFAWLIAMLVMPERRPVLLRLVLDMLFAGVITGLAVSPLLIATFAGQHDLRLPSIWPVSYSNDLLSFLVPVFSNNLGGMALLPISSHFPSYVDEQGAYIGLPVALVGFLFAIEYWRTAGGKLLIVTLLGILIASLGPRLWVAGDLTRVVMPWYGFTRMPLIASAEPDRFSLYTSLIISMIVAFWLAGAKAPQTANIRTISACFGCLLLMPVLHPIRPVPESAFFKPGRLEAALGLHARVLILPFGIRGPSSFWQQENQFGFTQTGGYLGYPPASMQGYPAAMELFRGTQGKDFLADFTAFCFVTKTQFVVVGPGIGGALGAEIAKLNWPERAMDDVLVYTVPGVRADTVTHG